MPGRPTAEDLATRPIINRQPDTMPDALPASVQVRSPAALVPDTQTPTAWSPRGTFVPIVFRGGYDPLSLAGEGIMHVPQADLYDASRNEFPNNGQWDRPHGIAFSGVIRLPRRTSAHPGFMMPTAPGPTMLFRAPPIFSVQTRPIPAVGV